MKSYSDREKLYKEWLEIIFEKAFHRGMIIENSVNSVGNFIFRSKNVVNCFDTEKGENCKDIHMTASGLKDTQECYHIGVNSELVYESHAIVRSSNIRFSHLSYDNTNLTYCDSCHNSNELFGCVGVKKVSYIIFNKQYSKEEYEALLPKVIEHMKNTGEFGEFFPISISPFAYNESTISEYYPLEKGEALNQGCKWVDDAPMTVGQENTKIEELSLDTIYNFALVKEKVFACSEFNRNYRFTEHEISFYERFKLSLPLKCFFCRHDNRMKGRLPRLLYDRICMCEKTHSHHNGKCEVEFKTSFSPDCSEIVYCEKCYQKEVY